MSRVRVMVECRMSACVAFGLAPLRAAHSPLVVSMLN